MVVKVIDFSTVSSSPLNPLSTKVRQFIWNDLQNGLSDRTVTSMVLTGGLVNFSAGADLTEFGSFDKIGPPTLVDVVQALEDSPKPIVAVIAGVCLGGGCELALACHYRVALDSPPTKLGLPEIHVGVIPGAGGTQRLPKVVGLSLACQMILTGAPIGASAALKAKLVDELVSNPHDLLDKGKKWALWAEVMPLEGRRLGQRKLLESAPVAHNILHQAELAFPKFGSEGLQTALRAIRASYLPLPQGMEVEKQAFVETLLSEQGQARRHAFFAVRLAQKLVYPQLAQQFTTHPLLAKANSDNPVLTAVVGAGFMGSGIAIVLLQVGFHVTIVDINEQAVRKGVETIQKALESRLKRKKIGASAAESMLRRLASTTRLQDLKNCQLVVEAVIENMQIKQNLFRELDSITPPSCILLSNTSTLDIDAMASVLQPNRQKWFLGWHFFSPAYIMKLVEIVRGTQTCPEATTLLQMLSKKVGKIGVVVGNCDGFCGNRLLRPYSLESAFAVEEGSATVQEMDRAIVEFGVVLGPFQLSDLAGNDVGYNIRRERGWTRNKSSGSVPPPKRPDRYSEIADVMVEEFGRTGQKSGKGWYDYDPTIGQGRIPLPSPEMDKLVQTFVQKRRDLVPKLSANDIVRRCFYPMVNEGFKCLEEGISLRPSDIDVVYIHGYGWPAWRGGPMYWADHQVGLSNILSWLQNMAKLFPTTDHFVPSALLVECVRKGATVEEFYKQKTTTNRKSKL